MALQSVKWATLAVSLLFVLFATKAIADEDFTTLAEKACWDAFKDIYQQQGDDWVFTNKLAGITTTFVLRGISTSTDADRVTEADRLNGITWQGQVNIDAKLVQINGTWRPGGRGPGSRGALTCFLHYDDKEKKVKGEAGSEYASIVECVGGTYKHNICQ